MTLTTRLRDLPEGVSVARDARGLSALSDPGCSAVAWNRRLPDAALRWLDAQDPATLPRGRLILPVAAVAEAVGHLCDISGLAHGPARDWLVADVADLARDFAALTTSPYLRVRLDVISTNACRKFHVDAVTARLVCTYRGTGTQYGVAANSGDPEQIFTMQTGMPILLRGTLWPAQPATGLVHRSPPIEGTGETRLVLVLDPISAEDAPV